MRIINIWRAIQWNKERQLSFSELTTIQLGKKQVVNRSSLSRALKVMSSLIDFAQISAIPVSSNVLRRRAIAPAHRKDICVSIIKPKPAAFHTLRTTSGALLHRG